MARAIDKRIMLDLIIEAKKTDPEAGPSSEWLAEYLVDHLPTLTPQNEWVSVEKRLPEDDAPAGRKQITVMVTTKAGKVTIASRVFEPERDYCGKVYPARWLWSRWLNNHVTHWMELPAPPDRRPPEGET